MLSHTSGIVSITDLRPQQAQLTQGGSPAQIVQRFRNQPLLFSPGTEAGYSSSGYILLGMVVEKVSGEPYAAFLQKHIFDPLGMADTGVDDGTDIVENLASGYRLMGGKLVHSEFVDMRIPFAAGDMYSTASDLARWEEGLYGGKLLRHDSLERMITPGMGDFGLGVIVKQEQGQIVISHAGVIQGFVADLRYHFGKRLAVVVLSNTESKQTLTLSDELNQQALRGNISLTGSRGILRDEILAADRLLFDAYNTCNIPQFSRSLDSDLEFYHDITGLKGHNWNVEALKKRCAEQTK